MKRVLALCNFWFFLFGWAPDVWAQGAAVIMPLSKYVTASDEVISFFIHNRLEEELVLQYSLHCDIDGQEQDGDVCTKAFAVTYDTSPEKGFIKIAKGGRVRGDVRLLNKDVKFAMFKPLFKPVLDAKSGESDVRFDLGYQPGYLFALSPAKERFSKIDFDTYVFNNARRARMKVDLSTLTMPQAVSVSAKLIDAQSKKMLRFVRLASDKIVDPKRQVLELESEFASGDDKTPVCYQIFVESQTTKDFYNGTNCN